MPTLHSIDTSSDYARSLRAAMVAAGADPSKLLVFQVCIDNTWGDLCGYAFAGPESLTSRAVQHAMAWGAKLPSSYGAQKSLSKRVARFTANKFSETYGTLRAELDRVGMPPEIETSYGVEVLAVDLPCVSHVYYPCAD